MGNDLNTLGGYSIPDLLRQYKSDLFDSYLPWLDTHVYDPRSGGFMCHIDREGRQVTSHKRTWYDGRGLWVYSFLYNHFGRNPEYLNRASRTVDFLLSIQSETYPFWPWGYERTGVPVAGNQADIYGSLFVAEGLTEFSKATGYLDFRQITIGILKRCIQEYDSSSYEYVPHYNSGDVIRAPRVLGHWMIFLNLCGQLLDAEEDEEIRSISDRCIDALLEHHLHPDLDLMTEYLHHDFRIPEPPLDQFAYVGHGIEVLWMVMEEAERREDISLRQRASRLFKRHVEVAWDDVFGGFFHEYSHVGSNKWLTDKVLWAQEEVLTGLMKMIAYDRDEWAIRWFDKVYPYVRENFILHNHPDKLWVNGGDRRLKVHHQTDRYENYHHPRHLMKNILVLEGLFSTLP